MKYSNIVCAMAMLLVVAAGAMAGDSGVISTDRFGYTGTVTRYATLEDAQQKTNAVDTVAVGNRDMSLFVVNNQPSYYSNFSAVMGSWWYTTAENTNGLAKDDPAGNRLNSGWGNTRGNTGVGYIQLYDADSSTKTSLDMSFSNFDGTYWTQFNMSMSGANANTEADYSRFSVYDNVNDAGIWHEYSLNLTASGLQGVANADMIEALNHPTAVSGSFAGLFELTENQTSPANQGFYVVDLSLDMTNWAFEQGNDALNGNFSDSYFAAVPEPITLVLLGVGGLFLRRRMA
jgi:hypothetical protein